MSAHFTTPTDELLLLAETLGEVKTKAEKLEAEFSTQARPLEAATNALSAALSGIKALQFHVLDNNLGQLSARVEEMRKAVDEQVGVIALELKKADETNAAKAGQEAEALRSEIAALQAQLGTLGAQFSAQLERVEFSAKEEAKKLQLIPGPAGAAGASLNPRGTFIDGETYNRLDVVSWLGSSYIAAVDGVTEKPSKNSNQWQVLASRGSGGSGGAGDFGSLAGVAQINQGGTGQTTRAAGLNALLPDQAGATQYMLLTDGAGTVSWGAQPVAGLPSQTSNSGRLLTTNGTSASWSNAVTVSGNNATVTGTLTANGLLTAAATTSLDGLPTAAIFGATKRIAIGYNTSGDYGFVASADSGTTWKELHLNPVGGIVKVPNTSASTTTSSGALVVGNGTSGGLGVGGAIFAGQSVSVVQSLADNNGFRVINTNTAGLPGLYLEGDGSEYALIRRNNSTAGNPRRVEYIATGSGANHYFNTNTIVGATTASTSTSSGALVVSGGVGVAGAINCGGDITAPTTANITGGRFTSVNSNSYIEQSGSDFNYVTASTRPHVFSIGGTTRFQVTTSGIISSLPASAASLTANSTMTFELTSNTSLKIFVRGSDGTTRSTTLTLA